MGSEVDNDFWGPEIVVNGERPDWLTGRVVCDLRTSYGWRCAEDREPAEKPAEEWAWKHASGKPCILSIRLPRNHLIGSAPHG